MEGPELTHVNFNEVKINEKPYNSLYEILLIFLVLKKNLVKDRENYSCVRACVWEGKKVQWRKNLSWGMGGGGDVYWKGKFPGGPPTV